MCGVNGDCTEQELVNVGSNCLYGQCADCNSDVHPCDIDEPLSLFTGACNSDGVSSNPIPPEQNHNSILRCRHNHCRIQEKLQTRYQEIAGTNGIFVISRDTTRKGCSSIQTLQSSLSLHLVNVDPIHIPTLHALTIFPWACASQFVI